jgi:hypothetical protein
MASAYDPAFDRLVMAGPIVDMIGDGRMEYDGPRCQRCGDPADDDDRLCDDCQPCLSCRGAGGFQQYDGLIIECPRGCITADGAA